jgi:hypothetical protein
VANATNYNVRELRNRAVTLTLVFTGFAVFFGCLMAPSFVRELGAFLGLALGLPLSAALAHLLRWKTPVVAYSAVIGLMVSMSILVALNELFYNPIFQAVTLLLTGIAVYLAFPHDDSLVDPSLCPKCGYPIGTSPVCTECGAAVEQAASK